MNSLFADKTLLDRLFAELDTWLGTPWAAVHTDAPGRHQAVKGVRGDCVQCIVAAFENAGIVGPITLPPYTSVAGFKREEEVAQSLAKFLHSFAQTNSERPISIVRIDWTGELGVLEPGDLLTFRFSRRDHHLGVYRGGRNCEFYQAGGNASGRMFCISSLREDIFYRALRGIYRLVPTNAAEV